MSLKRIACAQCGSNSFVHDDEGNLICGHCGTKFDSPREDVICSACGTMNPPQAKRCMNCGLSLGQNCPACNHPNIPGADHCENCGTRLDVLSEVFARAEDGGRAKAMALRERLVQSKAEDMQYMAEQRARIDAEDRERRARIAAQMEASRRETNRIILIMVIVVGIFVVLGLGAIILLSVIRGG